MMEEKPLDKSTATRLLVSVFALATTTTIASTPKELTAWTMEFASTADPMLIAMLATLGMEIMMVTEFAKTIFASLVALTTTSATTMKIACSTDDAELVLATMIAQLTMVLSPTRE